MNEYFSSVGSNLDSELPPPNDHENIPLQQRSEKSFYLFLVSTAECGKIITNLKNTKVDNDIIPVRLHKKNISYKAEPLTYITNKYFTFGDFPDQMKIAQATPILKKRRA